MLVRYVAAAAFISLGISSPANAREVWIACTAWASDAYHFSPMIVANDAEYPDWMKADEIEKYENEYKRTRQLSGWGGEDAYTEFLQREDASMGHAGSGSRTCTFSASRDGLLGWFRESKERATGPQRFDTLANYKPTTSDFIRTEAWPNN